MSKMMDGIDADCIASGCPAFPCIAKKLKPLAINAIKPIIANIYITGKIRNALKRFRLIDAVGGSLV